MLIGLGASLKAWSGSIVKLKALNEFAGGIHASMVSLTSRMPSPTCALSDMPHCPIPGLPGRGCCESVGERVPCWRQCTTDLGIHGPEGLARTHEEHPDRREQWRASRNGSTIHCPRKRLCHHRLSPAGPGEANIDGFPPKPAVARLSCTSALVQTGAPLPLSKTSCKNCCSNVPGAVHRTGRNQGWASGLDAAGRGPTPSLQGEDSSHLRAYGADGCPVGARP